MPVYRFWSAAYNGHFYTASLSERNKLILNYPDNVWKYEGVDYGAYTTQVEGTVPLYRFWSATYNGHFYTTSAAERDKIIATYPTHVWQPEGIAYYVYPKNTPVAPTKPVARFWSAAYMHHFYTADAGEATKVKNNYPAHIWKYETDDFRVSTTKPAAAPLPAPYGPSQEQIDAWTAQRTYLTLLVDQAEARILSYEADLAARRYWLEVAENYGDRLRAGVLRGEIAQLETDIAFEQAYVTMVQAEIAALPVV